MALRNRCFKHSLLLLLGAVGIFDLFPVSTYSDNSKVTSFDPLLGPRVSLKSHWVGNIQAPDSIHILVMAGHADSQGISGAGTSGEAVDKKGALPMDSAISDELFWKNKRETGC